MGGQPETSASSAYKRGDVAEKTELWTQRFDKLRPLLQTLLSLLVCSNVCRQSSNKKDVTGMYVHTWNVDDVVHGELNSTSN